MPKLNRSFVRPVGKDHVIYEFIMPLSVFCDESGFTGENLLNRAQKFFAYATVAIDPDDARDLVAKTVRDYGVQSGELKGSKLLRYAKGRRAILLLVETIGSRSQIVVHHKEYALATKFFEYAFEPLVSEVNSIFYAVNFHRFVGGILYLNMVLGHERATELSRRFEAAVREDDSALRDMFSIHGCQDNDPVEQLISFCVYKRDSILRELAEVKKIGGWILELTLTSLWSLLTHWGDRADSLRVVCDQSIPLFAEQKFINQMIGRTDKATVRFGNRSRSFLFNLAEPLALVDSKATPGVQLADVLAATVCHALDERRDEWSHEVLGRLFAAKAIHDDCVYPDLEHVDLRKRDACVNCVLLFEMVRRAKTGQSLTDGIGEFIQAAYHSYPQLARRHLQYDISGAPELGHFRPDG